MVKPVTAILAASPLETVVLTSMKSSAAVMQVRAIDLHVRRTGVKFNFSLCPPRSSKD